MLVRYMELLKKSYSGWIKAKSEAEKMRSKRAAISKLIEFYNQTLEDFLMSMPYCGLKILKSMN